METGDKWREGLRACPLPALLQSLWPQMHALADGLSVRCSFLTSTVRATALLFGENLAEDMLHYFALCKKYWPSRCSAVLRKSSDRVEHYQNAHLFHKFCWKGSAKCLPWEKYAAHQLAAWSAWKGAVWKICEPRAW